MKTKLTSYPSGQFGYCIHPDCAVGGSCLYRLAYENREKDRDYMFIVNPEKATKDESCRYYRSNVPVRFAWGFSQMRKYMYPDQYTRFVSILRKYYGRTAFYDRQKGTTPFSPKDQARVLEALRKAGVEQALEFDRYEEALNWED